MANTIIALGLACSFVLVLGFCEKILDKLRPGWLEKVEKIFLK
jgi:hypothetical protein